MEQLFDLPAHPLLVHVPVVVVLVVAGYFAKRLVGRVPVLATVSKVVLVAALAASISASGFTIQAGHNGAKARWIDIQFETEK